MHESHVLDGEALLAQLRGWGRELGFSQIGIAGIDLAAAEAPLLAWLDNGFHGAMDYMAAHGLKRARPAELVPGTLSVVTARLDYLPRDTPADWQAREWQRLGQPEQAAVSIYARGRDYHKVSRGRLQQLADRLADAIGPFGHRVFTDSAPVLEVELAARSGIGWRGKHTLALDRQAGSMFFLGEIYVDLALPPTPPVEAHCGSCSACIDVCPTRAIVGPYRLDARRCISYLTIELKEAIPVEFRAAIGNRIYGCDDCQLICPWNKYAQRSPLADFDARAAWPRRRCSSSGPGTRPSSCAAARAARSAASASSAGSAISRSASATPCARAATRRSSPPCAPARGASAMVREHIDWALAQAPAGP
jgi:epoxyqueuosine reductase